MINTSKLSVDACQLHGGKDASRDQRCLKRYVAWELFRVLEGDARRA
jgi:hypothetical protein